MELKSVRLGLPDTVGPEHSKPFALVARGFMCVLASTAR